MFTAHDESDSETSTDGAVEHGGVKFSDDHEAEAVMDRSEESESNERSGENDETAESCDSEDLTDESVDAGCDVEVDEDSGNVQGLRKRVVGTVETDD